MKTVLRKKVTKPAVTGAAPLAPLSVEERTPPVAPVDPETERESLVQEFIPKIKYLASRLSVNLPTGLTTDDLISAGVLGLMDAMEKYDATRNARLTTYAEFRIKGAMLDEIRSMQWGSRGMKKRLSDIKHAFANLEKRLGRPAEDTEVADYLGLSLEDLHKQMGEASTAVLLSFEDLLPKSSGDMDIMECIADRSGRGPVTDLNFSELKSRLGAEIDNLPEKEKLVMTFYYYEEMTMKEIGQILGITESRVCQLNAQGLMRLRGRMSDAK